MPFFPEIDRIRYEGPDSKNPLAFHHYNADEKVGGKSMRDHLRFSVVYWHTFRNPLSDPFGPGTAAESPSRSRQTAPPAAGSTAALSAIRPASPVAPPAPASKMSPSPAASRATRAG